MSALNILALNSGWSSLKFGSYRVDSAGAEKLFGETLSTVSTAGPPDARALLSEGMQGYGFHGLSLESILRQLGPGLPERLVIAHLGNGASKQVAPVIAVLGGVHRFDYTGGIGANDAQVCTEICAGRSWIGISLDEARKRAASKPVSHRESRCQVLLLALQEGEQIARPASALLA